MVRSLLTGVVIAVAGCSFHPSGTDGTGDGDGGGEVDASDGDATLDPDATGTDANAIDAPTTVSALCNVNDPDLRACFTFTGGTVTNGAGTTLTIQSQNVAGTVGPVGGAIGVSASSVIHIAEGPDLELPGPYTFEAFVRVGATPPATGRAGIYDENGEWGVFINDQRQVYCTNGPVVGPALALDTWTHVACVYDRTNVILYVGGQFAAMTPMTGDLTLTYADGGNLGQDCQGGGTPGDPLTGGIDEVRIWATARTAGQIAAAAAR